MVHKLISSLESPGNLLQVPKSEGRKYQRFGEQLEDNNSVGELSPIRALHQQSSWISGIERKRKR